MVIIKLVIVWEREREENCECATLHFCVSSEERISRASTCVIERERVKAELLEGQREAFADQKATLGFSIGTRNTRLGELNPYFVWISSKWLIVWTVICYLSVFYSGLWKISKYCLAALKTCQATHVLMPIFWVFARNCLTVWTGRKRHNLSNPNLWVFCMNRLATMNTRQVTRAYLTHFWCLVSSWPFWSG